MKKTAKQFCGDYRDWDIFKPQDLLTLSFWKQCLYHSRVLLGTLAAMLILAAAVIFFAPLIF